MLFTTFSWGQNTTISFFYGTSHTLGGEVLTKVNDGLSLGLGYGGTTVKQSKWCDIYAVSSFGYIGQVMIKEKAGLAVYTDEHKQAYYKPLIGIGAMYQVNKNYGLELGLDTFNKVTIGFCAIF